MCVEELQESKWRKVSDGISGEIESFLPGNSLYNSIMTNMIWFSYALLGGTNDRSSS